MGRQRYLSIAEEEAHKSAQNFKHGAVVVNKDGKIISTGHNKPMVYGRPGTHSIHAEVDALKNSIQPCEHSKMYVVRINTCGLANSKPCQKCQAFMKHMKVQRVIYTTDEGFIESLYM